jgi:hypothetical protein
MAITNGYCTLAEAKAYMDPSGQSFSANATDDGVIDDLVEGASRKIDQITGRTFYGRTETHYFDIPAGRELWLDDDLISVTEFLNGDGVEITTDDYILLHPNKVPYYAIRLKSTSTKYWQLDSNSSSEQVLSIEGSWGFSTTAPADIKDACLEIVKLAYDRRTGNAQQAARITAAGVVLTSADVPALTMKALMTYKRYS